MQHKRYRTASRSADHSRPPGRCWCRPDCPDTGPGFPDLLRPRWPSGEAQHSYVDPPQYVVVRNQGPEAPRQKGSRGPFPQILNSEGIRRRTDARFAEVRCTSRLGPGWVATGHYWPADLDSLPSLDVSAPAGPNRIAFIWPAVDACSRTPKSCAPSVDGGRVPAVGLNGCFTDHPFIQLYIF